MFPCSCCSQRTATVDSDETFSLSLSLSSSLSHPSSHPPPPALSTPHFHSHSHWVQYSLLSQPSSFSTILPHRLMLSSPLALFSIICCFILFYFYYIFFYRRVTPSSWNMWVIALWAKSKKGGGDDKDREVLGGSFELGNINLVSGIVQLKQWWSLTQIKKKIKKRLNTEKCQQWELSHFSWNVLHIYAAWESDVINLLLTYLCW